MTRDVPPARSAATRLTAARRRNARVAGTQVKFARQLTHYDEPILKMAKEEINFRILFRSPKYPVILVTEEGLYSAYNIKQLGTLCVFSKPFDDSFEIIVIDSDGAEFKYFADHIALMPGILSKKWTKKQIIELYNNSVEAKERNIEYPMKSISNKKVSRIIGDICELLKS